MDKRKFGRTGLMVSPIAIGGAAFAYEERGTGWSPRTQEGRQVVIDTLNAAVDQGMNYTLWVQPIPRIPSSVSRVTKTNSFASIRWMVS